VNYYVNNLNLFCRKTTFRVFQSINGKTKQQIGGRIKGNLIAMFQHSITEKHSKLIKIAINHYIHFEAQSIIPNEQIFNKLIEAGKLEINFLVYF
jgi:hypothetical protein